MSRNLKVYCGFFDFFHPAALRGHITSVCIYIYRGSIKPYKPNLNHWFCLILLIFYILGGYQMWLRENLGDKQNPHPWSFTCMVEIGL